MKIIKKFINYLKWFEKERIKASIYSGTSGPLI